MRQHQPEQRKRRLLLDRKVVPELPHESLAVMAVVRGLAKLLEAVAEALEGEVLALVYGNQRHYGFLETCFAKPVRFATVLHSAQAFLSARKA